MHRISEYLDSLSNILESKGFLKQAEHIDMLTNTVDGLWLCSCCQKPTVNSIEDRYMVNDDIWRELGFPGQVDGIPDDYFLCWSCLIMAVSKKLGRGLSSADFAQYMQYPINVNNPNIIDLMRGEMDQVGLEPTTARL